ncbi:MAG: TIGR01212 family radical SAM protein [Oligoflexia bacterium]|nr:TIGR01212 family radical SAM protein [Oligoflexia bacterium]
MQSRFYSYARYLQEVFGAKTYKVVVPGGLSCPTRDGTLARGGCAFCDERGSSSFAGKHGRHEAIVAELDRQLPEIRRRFNASKFLAYFQSHTNTHAEVARLRELYEEALSHPEVSGLCIGTRPDCLPEPCLELLEELAQRSYISLELGIQSFEDPTLNWLSRGHTRETSLVALERLARRAPHVHVCAHLMFGSPTDSPTAARDAARLLNGSGVRGTKLHQLMILERTELARRYRESPFPTLDLEQYAERVIDFIEHLSPAIYIERLYATSSHPEECLAPAWSRDRWATHNRLHALLDERDCRQGRRA